MTQMIVNVDGQAAKLRDQPTIFILNPDGTPADLAALQAALEAGAPSSAGCFASASFTPSASAYGALDIIDTPKEFAFAYADGTPVPDGSLIRVLQAVTKIDQTTLQSSEGAYTLQLYNVTPPSAQADNDAWTLASGDLTSYRGDMDLGTPVDKGAACYVKTQLTDKQDYKLLGASLFGRLLTVPAFTPGAVARLVSLYGVVL